MGPLAGLRVLDLGHAGVGPFAAGILAQLGADVIKCEPPWGDIINRSGGGSADGRPSALYITTNLGKRGIHLNMKEEADRDVFLKLVRTTDVYMDNLRADAADRLGIGYEVLSEINPRLVFVNSSGFGGKGPMRTMGSFEQYSDAFSGVSSVTGARGGPPERLPGLRVDPFTACCLVNMVLAGLLHRELTGLGQKIVGSQFESALQLATVRSVELNFGIEPGPTGSEHPHVAPSVALHTADRWVAVTAQTEVEWRNLCIAIGRSELMFDPRFVTNEQRVDNRDALTEHLAPFFAGRTARECVEALQARGVPAGEFRTAYGVTRDRHVVEQEMLVAATTPWGPVVVPRTTAHFSATPTSVGDGMLPGGDTDEVFAEVGVARGASGPEV